MFVDKTRQFKTRDDKTRPDTTRQSQEKTITRQDYHKARLSCRVD